MKTLFLALTLAAHGQSLLDYAPERRLPFDANFLVNTWQWDARPDPNPLKVYDAAGNYLPAYDELNGTANGNWPLNARADGIKVAVIDQGLHGAQVASIIGAPRDGVDLEGYAPGAEVKAFATSYADGDAATKINEAVAWGARIVNMSFGYTQNQPPTAVLAAMQQAPDVLFVLAALNGVGPEDTSRDWLCLASLPNALCVTANTKGNQIFGAYGQKVHSSGAGRRVPVDDSSFPFPQEATSFEGFDNMGEPRSLWSVTGTSFSAPRHSAAAALCLAAHPGETPAQIIERICVSADPFVYTKCGSLNVTRAVEYCRTYTLGITREGVVVGGPIGGTAVIESAPEVTGPWSQCLSVVTSGWRSVSPIAFSETQRFFRLAIDTTTEGL